MAVPVKKIGADHQTRPALACLAVDHSYVLLVFLQPPAVFSFVTNNQDNDNN